MSSTTDASSMIGYLENGIHVIESAKGVDPKTLSSCAGVMLISTKEKGLVFSVDKGTGVLLVNGEDGWSSPIAVSLKSVGAGAVFGYAKKDVLICLRPESLEKMMKGEGEVILGWDLGFACGKAGGATGPDISDRNREGVTATSYVYTFSQGALLGVESVDGRIKVVPEVNSAFYGEGATLEDIVSGVVSVPDMKPQADLIATLKTKVAEYASKSE